MFTMPARHGERYSGAPHEVSTITPEFCSRAAGIRVHVPLETLSTMSRSTQYIREIFQSHQDYLDSVISLDSLRLMNGNISTDTASFLDAIGFMVGACNIRGALELQGPFLRLTHRAIGADVKQVISSEWAFSPATVFYPGMFANYVLVGLPVPEAGNPLIAPLVGHELGHNVWSKRQNLQKSIQEQLQENITEAIKGPFWDEFSEAFRMSHKEQVDQKQSTGMVSPWRLSRVWGLLQCEEMFCDFFGLCLFGQGYLNAFQYLVSPGGGRRNPEYPSMRDRVSALMQASKELHVQIPEGFEQAFDACIDKKSDPHRLLLIAVSDIAARKLIPTLITEARRFCEKQKLMNTAEDEKEEDEKDVQRIFKSFVNGLPAIGARNLANIINAAWRISLDKTNHWAVEYPTTEKPGRRMELIRELTLKSFEVFEIERIQQETEQEKPYAVVN